MDNTEILGTIAGTLTTISFIPQVSKTWQSRSATDISFGMFILFSIGVSLWLFYGIAIGSWPIIISNSVTLALAISIILMKIRFDRVA